MEYRLSVLRYEIEFDGRWRCEFRGDGMTGWFFTADKYPGVSAGDRIVFRSLEPGRGQFLRSDEKVIPRLPEYRIGVQYCKIMN